MKTKIINSLEVDLEDTIEETSQKAGQKRFLKGEKVTFENDTWDYSTRSICVHGLGTEMTMGTGVSQFQDS